MLDSLVRFPGQLRGRPLYHTTLQATHQGQRRSHTGSRAAHARLSCPYVDALLTLAQGYSMVRYNISNACKRLRLCT